MKVSPRKLEFGWHVGTFLLLMGAFVPLWRQMVRGEVDPAVGDPVMRALLGVAYLGAGLLIFHRRRALSAIFRSPWLWVFVGWAFLSVLWSGAPAISLRRAASALLATLYGLLLYLRYPFRSVLTMLGTALAIAVLSSMAAILFLPEWGLMGFPHPGAWQGVFFHKNALGRACVLGIAVFGPLASSSTHWKRWAWTGLTIAALVIIIGSQSATALVLAAILAMSGALLVLVRKLPHMLKPVPIILALAIALVAMTVLPDFLLGLLGKDPTLTGRLPLWETVLQSIQEKPFLGYGYGAFWRGWAGPSAQVWLVHLWEPPHAHNGYLDLWLELGLVGLVLGLGLLAAMLVRGFLGSLTPSKREVHRFAYQFAFFFAAFNVVESVYLESGMLNAIYWIVFTYTYLVSGYSLASKTDSGRGTGPQ